MTLFQQRSFIVSQQVSGQEDLSYKPNYHRLYAPLWPSSLGITDKCHYVTNTENSTFESQPQKSGQLLTFLYLSK